MSMLIHVKRLKIGTYGICAIAFIAVASLLRIVLTLLGWPQTNSDEDTMGIMALHIAYHGEHPNFFYGQNYMGSLEAYLGAVLFRLFGPSLFTLRLGLILLFALFLVVMYLLTSLLYTKKLALITLALLSLGSTELLATELIALGGYPELLLFGALAFLLACWLALSYGQYFSAGSQWLRFLIYGCWGFVVGFGFWSQFLMIPFILTSGLLLVFCWRELLKGAGLFVLLGLVIGAFPLIAFNLAPPPYGGILTVLGFLHNSFSVELAQSQVHSSIPFFLEIRGTLLTGLPTATGAPPFCPDTSWRVLGYPDMKPFACPMVHGHLTEVFISLSWSLGFILLWTTAAFFAIRSLWKLRHLYHFSREPWTLEERRAIVGHFARLMLLASAAFTLLLFIDSPVSAVIPASTRYLISLLIATPALIAPLWDLSFGRGEAFTGRFFGTSSSQLNRVAPGRARQASPPHINPTPAPTARVMFKTLLRRGILVLVGIVFLIGTISAFLEVPAVQPVSQQRDALISRLLQMKATHIYTDYWTCYRIAFQTNEQIICAVLDGHLQPVHNRVPQYYPIVKADPASVYMFTVGSPLALAFAKAEAVSSVHYRQFVFEGYVIYQPSRGFRATSMRLVNHCSTSE